jgi:nitroimidazol reductase NimA-like FMN-containing flavoprotein (pyridoxamine 5'-phosphate oxidase superfamily)
VVTAASKNDNLIRVRRNDREIKDPGEIKVFLHRAQFGFIASSVDNQPFINSNLFWFDEENHRLYFHTAKEGRTRSNIEVNPRVCFSIAEIGEFIPADTAIEFSNEYLGVCVFGRAQIVESDSEQRHGLNGLLSKYFPDLKAGADFQAITKNELDVTSVFAIDIESWSGKKKVDVV